MGRGIRPEGKQQTLQLSVKTNLSFLQRFGQK